MQRADKRMIVLAVLSVMQTKNIRTDLKRNAWLSVRRISLLTFLVVLKFVPQVEPAPVSNWSPSPRSTDSSPVTVGMKRSRENGQDAEPDVEPAPKKAFGFEMKLSSNMVKILMSENI